MFDALDARGAMDFSLTRIAQQLTPQRRVRIQYIHSLIEFCKYDLLRVLGKAIRLNLATTLQ